MSIQYFDEETGKWVPMTSKLASGIKVIDTEGNFIETDEETGDVSRGDNVEDALKITSHKLKKLEERVEYIYENGTIGGGGGTGGSVLPTLKLISPFSTVDSQDFAEVSIPSDSEVVVEFSFQSPNIGSGTAYYSITGDKTLKETATISQGTSRYNLGKFSTGTYKLNIYVVDAGNMYSNTLTVNINVGSLEITSSFNDAEDYTVADDIVLNYTISTISSNPIIVSLELDGVVTIRQVESGGNYVWSIGKLSSIGLHKISISATSGDLSSNVLNYTIIVSDTSTMFISSNFSETEVIEGRDIVIPYRVSMVGETRAIIKKWINGVEQSSDTVALGTGNYLFWRIGNQLPSGTYTFELQATTTDGAIESNILSFEVNVIVQSFSRIYPVSDDTLLASFMADGKSSSSVTKNIWEDKSVNNISCTLHDFNHVTNGWDGYSLNFDGRAYAVIDLSPWRNNLPNGFCLDIYFKTENIGDIDAKVLWMKNIDTPNQGFYIDTKRASITSGNGKTIETYMQDSQKVENWQHVTFNINRSTRLMEIFINGVLTQVVKLNTSESFTFDGKIYLGGKYNNGSIESQGKCSIRSLNIYNRCLTDEEIVQNFISGLSYPEEQERVYRLNYDDQQIPRMDIVGNLDSITDDDDVTPIVSIDYVDYVNKTKSFTLNQCKISIQGTSSQMYPVKNYTIQLRANGQEWLYSPKDEWIAESRFTLKANYIDSSSANNISNARFFNDMIKAYHPYPSQQTNDLCRGAVDGFPIRLYINNEYQGLYTFNIDRYANRVYGFQGREGCVAYEVSANTNSGAGAFIVQDTETATWNSIKKEFKYRYHYAGGKDIVCDKDASDGNATVLREGSYHKDLRDLVYWVSDSSMEEFKGRLRYHFSVEHLIDYYLFVLLVGLIDNFGKNFVIAMFGKDVSLNSIFYPMIYDADSCLGLTNDGFLSKGVDITTDKGDFNTSDSRLWSKLTDVENGFYGEILTRYAQLRNEGWFTTDKLLSYINNEFIGKVGQRFYNEDARLKYTKESNQSFIYLCNGTRLEYTKRWLEERIKFLDSLYDYTTAFQKNAIIRTNCADYLTLTMKCKSPRYVKIKWSDRLNYIKYYVGSDKMYTLTSPEYIDNPDNNLDMLGVEDIVEIETFEHLKPSALHLSGMESLTTLVAPSSRYLKEVLLEKNTMLQKVDLHNCENLGLNSYDEATGNLNLINCSNLKYLDVSGTNLASLNIIDIDTQNPDASQAVGTGSLEYFDASKTSIKDITLWNQTYLDEILIADCTKLATISIGNCERLKRLSLPNSSINTFTIVDCNELNYIDISNTAKLTALRLDGCPNLITLKMKQLNSQTLTELDLTTVPKLEYLDISNSSFLNYITFSDSFTSLKTFLMRNSVLIAIRLGKRVEFPSYLDLSKFSLTSIDFYNCPSLTEIRGINYNGSGSGLFYNCYNLHTISGSLTLNENINQMCYNCKALVNLPTLNMKNVTGASESFRGCTSLTMNHVSIIMKSLGDKITSSWQMFGGCTSIVGEIPDNLFETTPNFSSLYSFFSGDTGITGTISDSLFAPIGEKLTDVRSFVSGCSGMTGELNNNMFSTNTNLQDTREMLYGTKITGTITNSLFASNPHLQYCDSMFAYVTTIESRIPDKLFYNNTELISCENMFIGCTGLYGTLPSTIFVASDGLTYDKLTNVKNFLNGCTGIYGNIPNGLFSNCPELLYCDGFFKGTDIYGDIPDNIFTNCVKLSTCTSFLENCTGLSSSIPSALFHNLTALSDVSCFFSGCTDLFTEIPQGMFEGCTNLKYMAGLFKNCQKLYGDIPTDLFSYSSSIDSIASLFENCYNLTSTIPEDMFSKCTKVQDMSRVFANCYNLRGSIPTGLFYGCVKVVTMASMFENCKSLTKDLSEEVIYFLPEDLFVDCPNLENVNHMFNMWGAIGSSSKASGEIPSRLFEPCSKLLYANYLFSACPIKGEISDTLFYRCKNLKEINYAFASTRITSLADGVFTNNINLIKVQGLFSGCSSMTGNAYQFWNGNHPSITDYGECYRNCTSLADYSSIPTTWK